MSRATNFAANKLPKQLGSIFTAERTAFRCEPWDKVDDLEGTRGKDMKDLNCIRWPVIARSLSDIAIPPLIHTAIAYSSGV